MNPMSSRFWTRRRFIQMGTALAGTGLGLGIYAWRVEPHWVSLVERDLPIQHLPDELAGKKLVQISDLHVGSVVDFDFLVRSLKWVSSVIKPDMTVITGDLMYCKETERVEEVGQLMDHLVPGPLGTYAILGNHDYGENWRKFEAADQLAGVLAQKQIRLLRNEVVSVKGLQLVGFDDLWSQRFSPELVMPDCDRKKAILTLCHNPDAMDLPVLQDWPGWVLAGHTHGGQVKPPFLEPPLLPVKNRRYTQGEFDLGPNRWLYINPGLGYLKRVRFNVRPEVTVFTLQKA